MGTPVGNDDQDTVVDVFGLPSTRWSA